METEHPKFKILGQEIPYPCSWPAVTGVAIVSLLVAFVVWVVFVAAGHEHLFAVSNLIQHRISPTGELEEKTSFRLIQFWTPSVKTQRDIEKNGVVPEKRKWEVVTEEKVDDFGAKLAQTKGVVGHRRQEVAGQGRSGFKHGWWWVVTIKDDFDLKILAKFYSDYWGNPDDVYLEEHRAHEHYAR